MKHVAWFLNLLAVSALLSSWLWIGLVFGADVNITWTDNSTAETGQEIERCTGASCTNFAKLATVGPNVTAATDTTAAEATTYCYRLRAVNLTAQSDYSNTSCPTTKLNAPSNTTASPKP